jgi:hypothetical protein
METPFFCLVAIVMATLFTLLGLLSFWVTAKTQKPLREEVQLACTLLFLLACASLFIAFLQGHLTFLY